MLMKLQFSSDKTFIVLARAIADIINTSSVNSISALQSRATAASYDSSLLSGLDAANSYIYRTTNPSNVLAHFSGNTYYNNKAYYLTFEFSVFDNTSRKFYFQMYNPSAGASYANAVNVRVGTAISGGTITSSQMPVTTADGTNGYVGTQLSPAGTTDSLSAAQDTTTTGFRTFWMYITNNGVMFAFNSSTNITGWPTSYNSYTYYSGPFICSQYTRDDFFNGEFANNVTVPFMYSNTRGTGVGFGATAEVNYNNGINPLYATADQTAVPFRVISLLGNTPSASTATPTTYTTQKVSYTVDGYSSAQRPLSVASVAGTANINTYQVIVDNNTSHTGYKIPNSTLLTPVFGHHDIGWEMSAYGAFGGSMSQLFGVYLFNGDYSPGDEYTIGGTTYVLWPVFNGYSNRVGLAVPKA